MSGESPTSSRGGTEYQRSVGAIRGSRSQNIFDQTSCSTFPTSTSSCNQLQDCDYVFDNFSQLFTVRFDKQAPKPKESQAQKSLIFMFEAIALQDKQRQQQKQKMLEQHKQADNKNAQQIQQQKNAQPQQNKEQSDNINQDSTQQVKNNLGNKPVFNTRAQRDAYFAEQLNQKNQMSQQGNDLLKVQKVVTILPLNNVKVEQVKQLDQQQQQQIVINSPTLSTSNLENVVSTLPSVASKIPKKRNLSIVVTSPTINTTQTANCQPAGQTAAVVGEKHKRENSANIKYLETHQTITINQDKEDYYNTDIYGQFNSGNNCSISTNNKNNNNNNNNNNNSSSNFINQNFNTHHHQRSKSNISYINLQTNSSSLTNYSINNNVLSSTQTSFFQNTLNQNGQVSGQASTKNSNANYLKNCFQQSYTSCNNAIATGLNKFVQKGNSKRKIVKISSKSQQSQHQNNFTITQNDDSNQNNSSNYNWQQQQQNNNTLLSINPVDGSKSLQNTQPISKKSFNSGVVNEDLFQLKDKGTNLNNKENINMNRKISLQESTTNSISSNNHYNLKTSKYIFNVTNRASNPQKNSFLSQLAQTSSNELGSVLGQFSQKFQNKKNLSTDASVLSNQLSLRQQFSSNISAQNNSNGVQQVLSQNNQNNDQIQSTRYSSKQRNTSRERQSKNNTLKNSANLKPLPKTGKFNIRTINQIANNPSSSTSMNSNNLYNAAPQTVIEHNFKSNHTSNFQSYTNIPDTISVTNE